MVDIERHRELEKMCASLQTHVKERRIIYDSSLVMHYTHRVVLGKKDNSYKSQPFEMT